MTPAGESGDGAPEPTGRGDQSRRALWASRSPGKVVARFAAGQVLKGYADFDPDRPRFRLVSIDDPKGKGIEIRVKDLKALFFVRSFAGNPAYSESKDLYQSRPPGTRKVHVEFVDGEELVGHMTQDPFGRAGFFFSPLDPQSNNVRVFAVHGSVSRVKRLL